VKHFVSLQFLNPIHSRYDSLDGGSARRKAVTYTGQHKHIINANIHALGGIRTHDPSVRAGEDNSCPWLRDHCDWPTEFRGRLLGDALKYERKIIITRSYDH
jgi:hypothetical protein